MIAMISSGALPNVAFRKPPTPGPVWRARLSVASPISQERGISATPASTNNGSSPTTPSRSTTSTSSASSRVRRAPRAEVPPAPPTESPYWPGPATPVVWPIRGGWDLARCQGRGGPGAAEGWYGRSGDWFADHPGAPESRSDGGGDGPLAVLLDQPDLCGRVRQRRGGGGRVEVAVGDQLTGAQAGPEQQPVALAALRGEQEPDDPVQPGPRGRAAVAGRGAGRRGRRPGQGSEPAGDDRQLARPGPDRVPG